MGIVGRVKVDASVADVIAVDAVVAIVTAAEIVVRGVLLSRAGEIIGRMRCGNGLLRVVRVRRRVVMSLWI